MKYRYFTFRFKPRYAGLGTIHEITFKAIDKEHALKQAYKYSEQRIKDDDWGNVKPYKIDTFVKEEIRGKVGGKK